MYYVIVSKIGSYCIIENFRFFCIYLLLVKLMLITAEFVMASVTLSWELYSKSVYIQAILAKLRLIMGHK